MIPKSITLYEAVSLIQKKRHEVPEQRCVLVGVTGIDGSGKGYVTKLISDQLQSLSVRVAAINIYPWLNLPSRFTDIDVILLGRR
ncbi:MAG TPA: hypothetical protein VGP68_02875 [Gemmataceae bacterium]|jgi:uridine kinase|nr:hypothetical protein [Gemmataceae bacterium]